MKLSRLSIALICLLTLAVCGPSEQPSEGAEEPAPAAEPEPQEAEAMTPAELGDEIAGLYVQALTELADLMKDRPAASDLQPGVEALKESYVNQLVELGRQRAALGDADKATVNSRVSMGIGRVPGDVFSAYSEGQRHYQQAGELELAKMIGDFNVITQYADFELLKQQAPDEAARLGIE